MSGSSQDDPFPECGTRTRKQFCTKMYSSLTSFKYFFVSGKVSKKKANLSIQFFDTSLQLDREKRISLQSYKGVLVCKLLILFAITKPQVLVSQAFQYFNDNLVTVLNCIDILLHNEHLSYQTVLRHRTIHLLNQITSLFSRACSQCIAVGIVGESDFLPFSLKQMIQFSKVNKIQYDNSFTMS